jgi:hypothetical protein
MAKLSETFTSKGGSYTAPSSNKSSGKLSETFSSNPSNFQIPTLKKVQEVVVAPSEPVMPSVSAQPTQSSGGFFDTIKNLFTGTIPKVSTGVGVTNSASLMDKISTNANNKKYQQVLRNNELASFDANDKSAVVFTGKNGNNITRDKINLWLQPDYQLSKDEKKQIKELINETTNVKNYQKYFGNVADANQLYQDISRLELRTKGALGYGVAEAIPGFKTAESVAASALDKANGNTSVSDKFKADQEATANTTAYKVGKAGSKMLQYYGLNQSGVLNPINSKLSGILVPMLGEKAGGRVANILSDEVADVILDTIPEVGDNIRSGMSASEVADKAIDNLKLNLLYNVGGEFAPDVIKAIGNKVFKKTVEEAVTDATKTLANEAADATKIANREVAESVAKNVELPKLADEVSSVAKNTEIPTAKEPLVVEPKTELPTVTQKGTPLIGNQKLDSLTNDVGVKPTKEIPNVATEQTVPSTRTSKVFSNTLTNNNLADLKNEVDLLAAQYTPHVNKEILAGAYKDVTENGDALLKEYLSDARTVASDTDVDRAMLLLHDLDDKIKAATELGNAEEADALKVQFDSLRRKLRYGGTTGGQTVQAFAKWNKTADGAVIGAEKAMDNVAKKWAKKNTKEAKAIQNVVDGLVGKTSGRLDKALEGMGFDGTIIKENVPVTREMIEERVRNSLLKEFSSVENNFNEQDVKYLASLIEAKTPVETITDELEHRLKHGKWYSLDESTPIKVDKSARLQKILDSMGNKRKEIAEAVEKNPGQIRREIENTFGDEFASVFDDLSEKDMDFIVDMMMDKRIDDSLLRDELEHYLKHGSFFEIDNSFFEKPAKVVTNKKLDSILANIGKTKDDMAKAVEPKSFEQLREEIVNSLDKESISVFDDMTEAEKDFLTSLFADGNISKDLIQDEIEHKLKYGKFFTIDESIATKQAENTRLKNILSNMMKPEEQVVEKVPLTFNELKAQVKETFDKELASVAKLNDDDVNYVANMMQNGSSSKEITEALQSRIANGAWNVSDDTVKKVNELYETARTLEPGSKARVDIESQIWETLADDIYKNGGNFENKFDAIRYMAMLGNLKTQVKNIVSTAEMHAVDGFSNNLAAIIESSVNKARKGLGLEEFERTKAVINPAAKADQKLLKAGLEDAEAKSWAELTGNGRWGNGKKEIEKAQKIFKSNGMNKLQDVSTSGLEKADDWFLKQKYSTALAGYLKGNGADASVFDAEYLYKIAKDKGYSQEVLDNLKKQMDLLDRARAYAIKKAQYATFHADSKLADIISQTKRNLKNSESAGARFVGKMAEGFIPFVKTPVNVLKNTIDFSPKSFYTAIADFRRGDIAEGIDALSKGCTGLGLIYAGYKLADAGIIRGKQSDYDKAKGYQDYSLNVLGHSFNIADITSGNAGFLVGVALHDTLDKKGLDFEDFVNAIEKGNLAEAANMIPINEVANSLSSAVEPISETSMLTGVTNLINSVRYAENGNIIPAVMGTMATNYLTQTVPTVLGQAARSIDNTRRTTYSANSGLTGAIEKNVNKIENKIPFLSKNNEPYIDMWGREQANSPTDNPLIRTAYQFAFPAYAGKINESDPVLKELDRIGAKSDISIDDITPGGFSKKIDGQALTPEEYTKYSKTVGQARYNAIKMAMNKISYRRLTDTEKVEVIKEIYNLANYIGKNEITGNGANEKNAAYKKYYNEGHTSLSNAVDYLISKHQKEIPTLK